MKFSRRIATGLGILFILAGCSGGGGPQAPGLNPTQNPNQPGPSATSTPSPMAPRIALRLEVVQGRFIDRVISSYRLTLEDCDGNAIRGPQVFPKEVSLPEQIIHWPELPVGNFLFRLELLDSAGNVRGSYQQPVALALDQVLDIANPAWVDSVAPPPADPPLPTGSLATVSQVSLGSQAVDCVFDKTRDRLYISRHRAHGL